MLKEGQAIHQGELLSYTIASGDMRYIEINKRDVYLRGDPQLQESRRQQRATLTTWLGQGALREAPRNAGQTPELTHAKEAADERRQR